jgi:NAD(P)-dependent dehydrogenase (short-subunit alcohol dehydrogenase family)
VPGRLEGKVAIVTGAGSRGPGLGNGRAISVLFAREGARVTLVDRERERLAETERLVEGEALAVQADVSRPEGCATAVAATVERWGRLDILVNNVGVVGPPGTAVDVDAQQWEEAMRVNVSSMMLMAKHAIPHFLAGGGGSIVNIGSVTGMVGFHPSLLYAVSKGAVIQMTRAMAAHHGRDGVRVNCVAPGFVYTPMVSAGGMSEETRAARRSRGVLGTEGTAWDVAYAVVYLASDEARWVTGVVLPVDAGFTAAHPPAG